MISVIGDDQGVFCQKIFKRNYPKDQEFPYIDLTTIHTATNYFSDSNKLGQGGFGPVYKVVTTSTSFLRRN